ncbi:hypothetical protein J4E90_009079 [Alternaria incomplexa]|uniref:uncharacterized protein n=1 Tax=Alternaria incomplexa TaxID=1187928 RepID=UPI00221F02D9|nr:uncharacterized protein J4E90_009079 [Alternaria incomplexa]KAI4907673.1 hypothetical protein J4E90_009079 [Alternaria incomplexa]
MFHQGSLQSGIALAIQEQKLVACFVRDDGATSHEWEGEWLKSGWLSTLLHQKAVVLRLEAGSTEAGFLAAFSDVSSVPTFVVIQNGQLQVQLKNDATRDDFINSIRRVLGANPIPASNAAPTSPPQASTPEPTNSIANAAAEDDLYGLPETSLPTLTSNTPGKQKATGSQHPTLPSTSATKAQQEARDALRKKKREDAEELARIKARIEADKAARKVDAELRKAEREKERNKGALRAPDTSQPVPTSSRGTNSKTVALNVRLFDGRTIRSTFPRSATLQTDVRSWVDTEFGKLTQDDENINNKQLPPYFFRHILAPSPSRELSAGDEAVELGDIDLAPSATLVLVPVKGYSDAYSGGTGGGIAGAATGIVGGAFGLLTSTVGYVGSTISSVIGYGAQHEQGGDGSSSNNHGGGGRTMGSRPTRDPSHDPVLDQATSGGMRVRTLADQRARDVPQQFYNGNQLSTEPRPEDNDKRD